LNHDRGVVAGGVSDRLRILEGVLKLLILRGSFFRFRAVLDQFRLILGIFWAHFSVFLFFSSLEARVSKATKSRLMYSSSRNKVKAPQLGPRGYRIFHSCPACGFRILCKACFTKMLSEYLQDVSVVLIVELRDPSVVLIVLTREGLCRDRRYLQIQFQMPVVLIVELRDPSVVLIVLTREGLCRDRRYLQIQFQMPVVLTPRSRLCSRGGVA
jgi:hypothetical protein